MKPTVWIVCLLVALAGCGGGGGDEPKSVATHRTSAPAESSQPAESAAAAPTMRGNAATNRACKLLTLEQVKTLSGLNVTGLLGLPTQGVAPASTSENCTWYLDSKEIQASLVVQYTKHPKPPADLLAYYPTVVKQKLAERVPHLGDFSKISSAVLDTLDGRYEIHVTLRRHYPEATPEDKSATIAIMRLVMAGVSK